MRPNKIIFLLLLFVVTPRLSARTDAAAYLKAQLKGKEACFLMVNIDSGEIVQKLGADLCTKRHAPYSTFKVPLVAMAIDSGYFRTLDQHLKWDGEKHGLVRHNQDQTPLTFIEYSVIWVSRLIVGHLGRKKVQEYVNAFQYGNKSVKEDLDNFWLSSGSVKISPAEQVTFFSNLWKQKFSLSEDTLGKVKRAVLVEASKTQSVYGKTGTGCLDPGCMSKPGRQIGWFAGVLEHKEERYAFALNSVDLKPASGYAGPKAKEITREFFRVYYP